MPLPLIPVLLGGAGATGLLWWGNTEEPPEEEPSFNKELYKTLEPFLAIALFVLALRWLYKLGST